MCCFYKLLTRMEVNIETVTLGFLVCFLCVSNKVGSYIYCDYANMANVAV